MLIIRSYDIGRSVPPIHYVTIATVIPVVDIVLLLSVMIVVMMLDNDHDA